MASGTAGFFPTAGGVANSHRPSRSNLQALPPPLPRLPAAIIVSISLISRHLTSVGSTPSAKMMVSSTTKFTFQFRLSGEQGASSPLRLLVSPVNLAPDAYSEVEVVEFTFIHFTAESSHPHSPTPPQHATEVPLLISSLH